MPLRQILFGFHGRIRRTTFWLAWLGSAAVIVVVGAVVFSSIVMIDRAVFGEIDTFEENAAGFAIPVFMVGAVVFYWTRFALMVKRCHDRNYPGALSLIALVPLVGLFWWVIDLGFIDGTPGPNRYGPSPKGLGETVDTIFS